MSQITILQYMEAQRQVRQNKETWKACLLAIKLNSYYHFLWQPQSRVTTCSDYVRPPQWKSAVILNSSYTLTINETVNAHRLIKSNSI